MKMAASQSPARKNRELGVPLLSAPSEKSAQPPPSPWPLVALGGKRSIAQTWRKVLVASVSVAFGGGLSSPSLRPAQGNPELRAHSSALSL